MGTSIIFLRKFFFLILLFICMCGCAGYKPVYLKMKDEFGKKVYKNRKEFFKEYALCSCLTQVSLSDSIGSKEASRSVYYDLSDDELMISNTGKKIDSNTLSYLDKRKNATGVTYENRKAPVFDCITYYRSKERSKFIAGLVASLRRNKK